MVVFTLRRLVFRHSSLLTRGPPFRIVDLRVKCVLVWRSYGEVRLHWVRVVEPELEQQTQTEPVMPGSAALVCVTLFFFYFFYYKSGESVTHKHTTYTRTHIHTPPKSSASCLSPYAHLDIIHLSWSDSYETLSHHQVISVSGRSRHWPLREGCRIRESRKCW